MSKFIENKDFIENTLRRKKYSNRTIEAYLLWMKALCDLYENVNPDEFTFDHVREFIEIKIQREKAKPSTVRNAAHSLATVFRTVYNKNFDIVSLGLPKIRTENVELLTKDEVARLLNNSEGIYKLIFATIYSAGLTLEELRNLRMSDVNFQHRRISVYQSRGKSSRKAVLALYLESELKSYIQKDKPQKWLFEGKESGVKISGSAIQRNFRKSILRAGIKKNVTPKNLKYSYVKHLYDDGLPLKSILKALGMAANYHARTYSFYGQIVYEDIEVTYSPLDRIIAGKDVEPDTRSIERMLFNVRDEDEREYLLEALQCIMSKVYRAAVIFAWTAAIRNIHKKFMQHSENSINTAIQKHQRNAPTIKDIDDFVEIKDGIALEASETLGIFEKNQKNTLVECLGLRNKCGHPSKYNPQPIKVAAFLEDLVQIVFTE